MNYSTKSGQNEPNSNSFVENQDLLLGSTNLNQPESSIDFFSFISSEHQHEPVEYILPETTVTTTEIDEPAQLVQLGAQPSLTHQQSEGDFKEEIIDFNFFEMLRSEDPDVAELLETFSASDCSINYLPQISVNTTTKVLEEAASSLLANSDLNQPPENSIENKNKPDQIKDLSNLLDRNTIQTKSEDAEAPLAKQKLKKTPSGLLPLTPPRTPPTPQHLQQQQQQQANATRVSLRLIKKRDSNGLKNATNKSDKIPRVKSTGDKLAKKSSKILATLKRKRSVDVEEGDENSREGSTASSDDAVLLGRINSENSVDSANDEHIYYDDDEDDEDDDQHNDRQIDDDEDDHSFFNHEDDDDDSNEREFKEFVRNYNSQSSGNGKQRRQHREPNGTAGGIDPAKKESNKEAATRYRLKKLSEKDKLFETRMILEKDNGEVKRRIEIVQTEINYLKNLLVQMLLTKDVLGSTGLMA